MPLRRERESYKKDVPQLRVCVSRHSTGAGVHKGFNKHTGTYNHISKSAHFLIILFCGTKYLQKVRDEKTGEILRYLPFFGI